MKRASSLGLGAAAVAVVVAVIALVIAVRRGPEAPPPSPAPAGSEVPPAPAAPAAPGPGSTVPRLAAPTVPATPPAAGSDDDDDKPPDMATAAKDERDSLLNGLVRSGDAKESWDGQGGALLDEIGAKSEGEQKAGCFTAGCGATYTFSSPEEFDHVRGEVEALPDFQAWTGGKRWTPLEPRSDGRVVTALLLYRPD